MLKQALLLVSLACSGALAHPVRGDAVRTPEGQYRQVTPALLKSWLSAKDFVLLNVHVPDQGEIPGTDRKVAFDRIGLAADLPRQKDAEIVVYCRSGSMSAVAARTLVKLGYTNVRELRGGMNAWESAGYVLRGRKP